jgi:exodeoxyribonuclease V alpha subunit
VNVVRLDKIHRQSDDSYISVVANEISKGKVVEEIPADAIDVKWHDIKPDEFSDAIPRMLHRYLQQNDINDLQFIAPMYKGPCGVNLINEVIQKVMVSRNGTANMFLKRPFVDFFVGDRVIQTKNNYEKDIYNGDMGIIVDLGNKVLDPSVSDQRVDFIIVDFYGDHVTFLGEEINQLKLAWCITVHKFQGSQSKAVLFVMADEARIMMSKELVYTAFTRAEKYLSIFGSKSMLRMAPQRSVVKKRYTNFRNIIAELDQNRSVLKVLE